MDRVLTNHTDKVPHDKWTLPMIILVPQNSWGACSAAMQVFNYEQLVYTEYSHSFGYEQLV
jgi:hypothetical protein